MTLPVDNYNDIINILNASVEKIKTDTTDGRTDSVSRPLNFKGRGCVGCSNNNPDLPGGEVVLARGGCLGRRVIKNLPTITVEELGDIEFKWDYDGPYDGGDSCDQGHYCDQSNFKLYINDVFVSDFDFNNTQTPGLQIHGKFKLKDKLNSEELNNIIKNRTRRTCSCKFKNSSDSEECRELELQVKIFPVNSTYPQHVVGQIQFTIKNETWKDCLSQLWSVFQNAPLVFSNPLGKGYCICLRNERWYPPDTDTATVAL